jgi:RsiW-degrading membrane proteinase PrsW (M82 family)
MSKYKVKASPKKDVLSSQDAKEEKQFFRIAIIVTIVVIVLIYAFYNL